ncbi:NAD(P)/FAD-dependent oxidoreductase [Oceanospirillum linum]|uniref:Oxidoreductase n=1 Tax=Oceanospirillum linum TaxID=966 RepID=A0A1T1H9L0_OCELI|nr:FAD-dependent oxidoreductase [Oceanospirillum linum]OOV86397.1 oxidoreductase [Oceanospirillum linum]SEG32164.1 Glycine/D-amino acid oxidase [Oleiphilus messinensis]SMP28624.1 Glycine/D-amino acid oxidase [Oceanospirillum linum]
MIFPQYDGRCGWYEMLPSVSEFPSLTNDIHVHTAIVGGGFVGMAAARRLAENLPDKSFVLLDALKIGQGASGRNSGFVIDQPHKRDLELASEERKRQLVHLNRTAINYLEKQIDQYSIQCQWSHAGKYQAAVGARGEGFLNHYEELLKASGEHYLRLSEQERQDVFGTSYYNAAIFTPGGTLMQPAALMQGLADNLPENVSVYEKTPVKSLVRDSEGFVVRAGNANIYCQNIILATNIFTSEFGYLKDRILPIMTFASMTRPLNEAEMKHFGGQLDWGITPADHGGTTLRMTQDRRLIVRNSYRYAHDYNTPDAMIPVVKERHRKSFSARYPDLKGVEFEYTWGGASALSRNFETYFGELEPGIFSSNCDQSVGAARGTISGMMLADKVASHLSEELKMMEAVSGRPSWLPPKPLLRIGVPLRLEFERFISRSEF